MLQVISLIYTIFSGTAFFSQFCKISFERESYTFSEPAEFMEDIVEEVLLLKNKVTELTYSIFIQIRETEQPELGSDYIFIANYGPDTALLTILPDQQNINYQYSLLELSFFLSYLIVNLKEKIEVLEISHFPGDYPEPAYQQPLDF